MASMFPTNSLVAGTKMETTPAVNPPFTRVTSFSANDVDAITEAAPFKASNSIVSGGALVRSRRQPTRKVSVSETEGGITKPLNSW